MQDLHVSALRPTRDGNQAAIIAVCTESAWKLRGINRIQVGWISCRIRERVLVERCYKCWAVGHKVAECNGPDRSKLCFRCGASGHIGKNCDKSPYCPMCEAHGHSAGTTSCTAFKEAIIGRQNTTEARSRTQEEQGARKRQLSHRSLSHGKY